MLNSYAIQYVQLILLNQSKEAAAAIMFIAPAAKGVAHSAKKLSALIRPIPHVSTIFHAICLKRRTSSSTASVELSRLMISTLV